MSATTLSGQSVLGAVTARATGEPLPGAYVTTVGENGQPAASVLTGPGGSYIIRLPDPGIYRFQAELIGYASALSETVSVAAGATRRLDLSLAIEAVSLEGIQVEAHQRCRPRTGHPADRLMEGGYIQAADEGGWDYYAPDAAVLLSDTFLETHCFHIEPPPRGEPGLVGLGFAPTLERSLSDIAGVLWLDRASAELRRLDYRYVALPFRHGDWEQVGGRVEFQVEAVEVYSGRDPDRVRGQWRHVRRRAVLDPPLTSAADA